MRHHLIAASLICALILPLVLNGCSGGARLGSQEKTAAELLEKGLIKLDKGHYTESIDILTKLRDWYPFSKHAITAELKIADAHYRQQEYVEAIVAYETFVNLHPRNDWVPYAIYQVGTCFLDQVKGIDQDQTSAQKAHDTFQRLLKQFPDSEYTAAARAALKTCRKSILRHELYVAKFYLKSKHYKAALNRFRKLLDLYPDVGVQYEALDYITRCEVAVAEAQLKETE